MDTLHPSILFMGRLEKIKGVDILIRSIPFVANSIPDVHLYIAGSGEEEGKLKHLVKKLDIGENVTLLGFVSEDEKWSYYKSTDLCVVPSVEGPFGIVLLEAMACGKPVIASNVGGIPYIVEDGKTGLLFECGDIEGLTEKVSTLLQNKEMREKMGAEGLEKAKEFSWDMIAERTVELYKEVISEAHAR
jgi:glycosyltransferase involved in cell wall biosynthesis